jgi:pilus assembly protein CpaB
MGRRTLLLIASILVAAVGTGLVGVYVRNADNRVQQGQEQVQVFLAKERISPGIDGDTAVEAMEATTLPRSALTPGAIGTLAVIRSQFTLVQILPGQQIVRGQFGTTATTPASASGLKAGKVAVAVQLSESARVAGTLMPGSNVAIYANVGEQGGKTRLLYPSVRVMGVGTDTTAPASTDRTNRPQTEGITGALVTLELDPGQAGKVIYASTYQQVSLSVLGPNNPTPPSGVVNAGNLFD